jgi:hypothetical protein
METGELYVILDPEFGERLKALRERPVWITRSPVNEPVIRSLRSEASQLTHLNGITSFTFNDHVSPEDRLIEMIDTIDLHHGPYSSKSPYTDLKVIGARLTSEIRATLNELGFSEFFERDNGFSANRSAEEAQKLRRDSDK